MAKTKPISLRLRDIRCEHLEKIISVKGYLVDYTEVRPRIVSAKFKCPSCGAILEVSQLDEKFREPSKCSCGYSDYFEELSKEMIDMQRIVLSETKNRDKPHSEINVFLKEDLTSPKNKILEKVNKLVSVTGRLSEVPMHLAGGGIPTALEFGIDAESIK